MCAVRDVVYVYRESKQAGPMPGNAVAWKVSAGVIGAGAGCCLLLAHSRQSAQAKHSAEPERSGGARQSLLVTLQ